MNKKNNNLEAMAAKARERGITYGQLQTQETIRKLREDKERKERIQRAYDKLKISRGRR